MPGKANGHRKAERHQVALEMEQQRRRGTNDDTEVLRSSGSWVIDDQELEIVEVREEFEEVERWR